MKSKMLFSKWSWFVLLFSVAVVLLAPGAAMAQEAAADAAQSPSSKESMFLFIIKSVGFLFGIVLLGTSMWMVALCVLLALDLRMIGAIPPGFVDEFSDTVNKRKFKEAYDMAKADSSFLGRVLTAGMSRLQYGLEDAREAAQNQLESIKSDKEQKNNYLAVIATLGPMLGLVGTVFGMIGAFQELGSGTSPNPAKLADNIAHALSVTLIGIAISCPAIAFNAFFRNRINRVTLDVAHIADDLLTQMYHNSKKPGGPAMPAMGTPPGAPNATAAPATQPPR